VEEDVEVTTEEQLVMVHKEIQVAQVVVEVKALEVEVDVILLAMEDRVMVEDLVETEVHISHMAVQLHFPQAEAAVEEVIITQTLDMVEMVEEEEDVLETIRRAQMQLMVVEVLAEAVVEAL
jgi:hypothetical protein